MGKKIARLALVGPALLFSAALGAAEPSWLHVQVTETGAKESKVSVNLPLSLLDVAFDMVPDERIKGGRVQLGKGEVKLADMRRMWAELKKAGDTEFVTVEEKDETVRIERKGARVQVRVTDKKTNTSKVNVDVPMSVVDALLQGDEDSLDLRGALAELKRTTSGEFINVNDDNSRVRVWID
jgi:poly(3-hydroxybutyrate) depolymerase